MDVQDVHDVPDMFGQDLFDHSQPEDYRIDGDTSLPLTEKPKKLSKSRNLSVKIRRNSEEEYMAEKTNEKMAARRDYPLVSNCTITVPKETSSA